jgi:hypothetical protein
VADALHELGSGGIAHRRDPLVTLPAVAGPDPHLDQFVVIERIAQFRDQPGPSPPPPVRITGWSACPSLRRCFFCFSLSDICIFIKVKTKEGVTPLADGPGGGA